MYINFWYPMATSEEVADEPVRVEALGQSFALFRDPHGVVNCLADTCIHRGGSLGTGKRCGDNIECSYHGWQFDGAGRCRKIPTLPDGDKIPSRARVDSYPVEERYGLVFAFLGDLPEDERPPIMEIEQWDLPGWGITSLIYDWDANFERVIENGLDATHTEFVHPSAGLQGSFKPRDDQAHILVDNEWGSAYQINSPELEIEHGHHGAAHQWTFLTMKMESFQGKFRFYSFVRPIDAHSVRRYLFHARDSQLGDKMDKMMYATNLGFEKEDRPVIERMRPMFSPRDTTSELLLPEDRIMVRYREFLETWRERGWQIDIDEVRRTAERKLYAVPSPGRRDSANWVVDEIPRLPAD
jgi:phenylpropionate dioxygenase-like ring-hydroxylating dioxygenase large terminal subunit